jgi:hypothetical protein
LARWGLLSHGKKKRSIYFKANVFFQPTVVRHVMYFSFILRYIRYSDDDLLKDIETCGFIKHLNNLGVRTDSCLSINLRTLQG